MAASSLLAAAHDGRDPDQILRHHRENLRRLEDVAESCWGQDRFEDAVAAAGMAAWLAGSNHPGVLASPRLEAVLADISRRALPPLPSRRASATPERVLVVATETYAVGGHTRLICRWIERDRSRVHTVVTTSQRGVMPEAVRAAVRRSGGEIVELPTQAPALERAAALRGLAAYADVIVLIDHPHDPLPTVAFAGLPERPPIVMMNHGDQWFWLGRSVVDVLMNIRSFGTLVAPRRGLPPARVLTTPFPVSGSDDHGRRSRERVAAGERAQARASVLGQLGWPPDTVLLVTVGHRIKYDGTEGHRLIDLIEPVLAAAPQTRLVAAGPDNAGQWLALRERTGGRVAALGQLSEGIGVLHAAGDIYVESQPLGGPGASAEAAAHGLPVISAAVSPLEREYLMTDAAYGAVCLPDHDAYRALLNRLIAEPVLRAEFGDSARRAIAAADEGWEPAVERAYALARTLGPIREAEFGPLPEPDDVDVLVDFSAGERRASAERLELVTSLFELTGRSPAVRRLYRTLDATSVQQVARYVVAFAAPPPHADTLRAIVEEFRVLRDLGVAEKFMIALEPDALPEALPVLEAALEAGTDVDIEVVVDPEPARLRPPGSLEVVLVDDGGEDLHRHTCRAPAAVS